MRYETCVSVLPSSDICGELKLLSGKGSVTSTGWLVVQQGNIYVYMACIITVNTDQLWPFMFMLDDFSILGVWFGGFLLTWLLFWMLAVLNMTELSYCCGGGGGGSSGGRDGGDAA